MDEDLRCWVRFLLLILTLRGLTMFVTEKGQVTIPKAIRLAAGVVAGAEVVFSLEGGKIVITLVATAVRDDRRAKLRAAAARVRGSLNPEFAQMGADDIMDFLRAD
jgi:antitoxin PrlF